MLWLFLAIASSSAIALVFKVSESRNANRFVVTAVNYIVATTVALGLWLTATDAPGSPSWQPGWQELVSVWSGSQPTWSSSVIWAMLTGGGAGVLFFLGFIYYQVSVRKNGVGLAGAFAKLGIFVPVLLSFAVWQEAPTLGQWIGIGMGLLAVLLIAWPTPDARRRRFIPVLILLSLFGGLSEFSNKVFESQAVVDAAPIFLAVTFTVAGLLAIVTAISRAARWQRSDILLGVAVGIPNLFSSYFLIQALERLPATVSFAAFGAGTILLVNLAGVLIWRERLHRREWAAVIASAAAVVVVNW